MTTECVPVSQEPVKPEVKVQVDEPTPETEKRYKCHTCHNFFYERHLVIIKDVSHCPVCGETHLQEMCRLDHNGCTHEVIPGIKYCPVCGDAICPECGTHDVVQISRVTGYLSDVYGWNTAKRQELKDRVRFTLPT